MAKYKAYPEYKDSGVEWLGVIPKGWTISKVKYLAPFQVGWTPPTKNDANFIGDNLWVNISDLKDKFISSTAKCISDKAAKEASMDITPRGSLLYSFKLSVGAVSFAGCDLYTNEAIASFLDQAQLPLSYLYYALPIFIIENASTNIYGAKILNQELIKNSFLLAPSHSEAKKVAQFLDHETAKIDNLIEKQQQMIELLKEKCQAVISNVVNIRSNERKTKLKNLVNMQTGYPFPSAKFKFSPDNSIALLRGVNVGVDSIKWDDVVYWDVSALDRLNEYLLVAGDIVFGMDRPWISSGTRVSEIKEQDLPCLLLQRVARIRSNIKSYQPFIKLCLSSNEFREYAEIDLTGVSVPHISPEQISNFYVKDIPFDEQINLTKNALEKIGKIKIIQAMSEQTIQILQERRAALISAAVTGKIDVRDWVAPDTQDVEEPQEATA